MRDVVWFVRYPEDNEPYSAPQLCRFVPAEETLLATVSYTDDMRTRGYYQTGEGRYIEVYDMDVDDKDGSCDANSSCNADMSAAEVAEALLMSRSDIVWTEVGKSWIEEQMKNAGEV